MIFKDRILYKGRELHPLSYHRAELRSSDHRPGLSTIPIFCFVSLRANTLILVYASFLARVRRIDPEKKAALARLITERVVATGPGEKLDDKLADLTFKDSREEKQAERKSHIVQVALWRLSTSLASSASQFVRLGLVGSPRASQWCLSRSSDTTSWTIKPV